MPLILNLDASSFDSGQRGLLRDIQADLIRHICPSAAEFWNAVVMNPNHMTSPHKVGVHTTCCKNSGELDTASGNTLLTLLMILYVLVTDFGFSPLSDDFTAFGEGDDNTIGTFCEEVFHKILILYD